VLLPKMERVFGGWLARERRALRPVPCSPAVGHSGECDWWFVVSRLSELTPAEHVGGRDRALRTECVHRVSGARCGVGSRLTWTDPYGRFAWN
jgi:hypothetical protein